MKQLGAYSMLIENGNRKCYV